MHPEKRALLFSSLLPHLRLLAFLSCALLFCSLFLPYRAFADNWQAKIYNDATPSHLVGVDKKNHLFNFFEKKSPLRLRYSYPCVTGQASGDKMQVNDLRTPEGVYFVEYKIANGLDFREYGGIAYTLNYPNPVDRARGKTGHGIWIHSKGFELVPTRGCVAINLRNIAEVGPNLTPGTPVILAEELRTGIKKDDGTLARLCGLMNKWSQTWAARSPELFDFYDPDAYTKGTESFTAFRQNKERLFRILSFIKIYNREIHALEGPGYWVTWSEQFYTASNLSTEGVRRLYWQKNRAGEFRIVGMEWIPRDVGMKAEFQRGKLVAEGPVATATDASSEAPVAPKLDMPEQADDIPAATARLAPDPIKDVQRGEEEKSRSFFGSRIDSALVASISSIAKNLIAISEPLIPQKRSPQKAPDEFIWGQGKSYGEPQRKDTHRGVKPEAASQQEPVPEKSAEPAVIKPETAVPVARSPKTGELVLNDQDRQDLTEAVGAWLDLYGKRDENILHLYDSADFNHIGISGGESWNNATRSLRKDFKNPWILVLARAPEMDAKGNVAHTRMDELVASPTGLRQGIRDLWWKKDREGRFRITGSRFTPDDKGMEADYLEKISSDIVDTLAAWRKAWESGNLDAYMSFYTADALQQGKAGQSSIRKQKEALWNRVKPKMVKLAGLRVLPDGRGVRADMTQAYEDSSGRGDKGIKTLFLRYDGKRWLIQREDWARQEQARQVSLP